MDNDRKCEYCGCQTNAYLRRCCDAGYVADGGARLDADRMAKAKTRIVHHPNIEHCVGPGGKLSNPEYENEYGEREALYVRRENLRMIGITGEPKEMKRLDIKTIADSLNGALVQMVGENSSHGPLFDAFCLLDEKKRHDIAGLRTACRAAICALAHAVEEAE